MHKRDRQEAAARQVICWAHEAIAADCLDVAERLRIIARDLLENSDCNIPHQLIRARMAR